MSTGGVLWHHLTRHRGVANFCAHAPRRSGKVWHALPSWLASMMTLCPSRLRTWSKTKPRGSRWSRWGFEPCHRSLTPLGEPLFDSWALSKASPTVLEQNQAGEGLYEFTAGGWAVRVSRPMGEGGGVKLTGCDETNPMPKLPGRCRRGRRV